MHHSVSYEGVVKSGWHFSEIKGERDDDNTNAEAISCVEFNQDGNLLATGNRGGIIVVYQRDPRSKTSNPRRGEFNVYSSFQSHKPEFVRPNSLEIQETNHKIRWLKRINSSQFFLSSNNKTIKLWKISEHDKCVEGFNTKEENGQIREPGCITSLCVPSFKLMDLKVKATPRRVFCNAHDYFINSISLSSDQETYLSADDLRINLWNLEITNRSFNIIDIKPANMEELTEVITAAEFHPRECNIFVYSSSKGTIRLCDMRSAALCDQQAKTFQTRKDYQKNFREILGSISDLKMSHSGRYMMSRNFLGIKVWDLRMETKPIETYLAHDYLRMRLPSLLRNDCIFDKFECCWSGSDSSIITGSYNNFFKVFDRNSKKDVTMEASKDHIRPRVVLTPRKIYTVNKRSKDEIFVDDLDFTKKVLYTAWHPLENIIAVAAQKNVFIFQQKF